MKKSKFKSRLLLLTTLCVFLNLKAQNNALIFNGTTDYGSTANTVSFVGASATLEAWVYINAFQATSPYISRIVGVGNGIYLRLGDSNIPDGNRVQFVINFGGTEVKLTSPTPLKTGFWYHIAGTYDGSYMRIYINGGEDAFLAETRAFNFVEKLFLGAAVASPASRYLNGTLDEVRIWSTALNITQIRNDMYREIGVTANLLAYYKLNQIGVSVPVDASGNGNTLNLWGLLNSSSWIPSPAFAGPKNALNFTLSNAYAGKGSPVTTVTDNFTMMGWFIAATVPTNWSAIVYNGTDAGGYGFGIENGVLKGLFGSIQWITTTQSILVGRWYHVALRRKNGLPQFFVDGKLLSGTTYGVSSTYSPNTPVSRFTVGNMFKSDNATLFSNSFNGEVDEVRVYSAALTDAQIRESMNRALNGNEANLVAYYNFDFTTGGGVKSFDGSGSANDINATNIYSTDWRTSTAFNTWLNTSSTSWNTIANWSRNAVPSSINDNISLPNYLGGSTPTVSSSLTINSVVVEGSLAVTGVSTTLANNESLFNYGAISGTGNLVNNGVFINGGTITVNNFTVNNGATTTIDAGKQMTLSGNLTNNGIFTINSDASTSGSLIVSGTSTGNITYNRYMTGVDKWHLISAPVGGQDINTFVTTGSNNVGFQSPNYSLTPYDNTVAKGASGIWNHWTSDGSGAGNISGASSFVAGKGYEVLRTADGTMAFTGTVAVANVSIAITKPGSANAWNLIGNPFPSSLFANSSADATNNFIDINTAALETSYKAIYLWDPVAGSYDLINNASAKTYIAPGQGFFVKSVSAGATVSFTTAMRTNQSAVAFQKMNSSTPSISLIADDGNKTKTTAIKYIAGKSLGLDPGYDAGLFDASGGNFNLYTKLVADNGVNFMLQVLPDNAYDTTVIPIGLDADAGTQITFKATYLNLPIGKKVYLEDRLLGSFTELNNTDKTYTVTLSTQEQGTGRFYLRTQNNASTLGTADIDKLRFTIVAKPRSNTIRVIGNVESTATLNIYDTLGRFIYTTGLKAQTDNEVSIPQMATGIYFVKIKTTNTNLSTKIAWY